jgi:hypothetical protein
MTNGTYTLRVDDEAVEKAIELLPKIASDQAYRLVKLKTADVLRMALAEGLELLEAGYNE